jgi:multidrug transporter EmrE-like cation transporter
MEYQYVTSISAQKTVKNFSKTDETAEVGLAVFTFLSPVFGVAAGVIILGEQLTTGLIFGLLSVSAGIYVTNYRKGKGL